MEESHVYACKECDAKVHSVEDMKKHAKEAHGMDISDDEAKMMEDHEHDH